MNLETLLSGLDRCSGATTPSVDVSNITFDSRSVIAGDLFVCLPGSIQDGHRFAGDAIRKGAVAILAEHPLPALSVPVVVVKDTRRALAEIASRFYNHPSRRLKVIGVTGTNGKTTTVHLLQHVLNRTGHVSGSIGTLGMKIRNIHEQTGNTTPESLEIQRHLDRMLCLGARYAVMEVSSHALIMGRLEHCHFHSAVFTNLTHDHLDYHKTLDEYRRAKGLLFSGLSRAEEGNAPYAVLNMDDPSSQLYADSTRATVRTYGLSSCSDVWADNVRVSPAGTSFLLHTKDCSRTVRMILPGRHNVYNALATICMGLAEDISLDDLIPAIEEFRGVDGRYDTFVSPTGVTVIVDYAHTPDALENLLRTTRHMVEGRIFCVFGCEGDRDRQKRPMMADVVFRLSDSPVLTLDNTRNEEPDSIFRDMVQAYVERHIPTSAYTVIHDRRAAIWYALERAQPGDAVVIAGKGHETVQILGNTVRPFNDKQVALEFFDKAPSLEEDNRLVL